MQRFLLGDLPTRIFHWELVLCLIRSFVSVQIGGDAMVWYGRFGVTVVGLRAFRLVWGFFGSTYARLLQFVRGPGAIKAFLQRNWQGEGHNPLGASSVFAMRDRACLPTMTSPSRVRFMPWWARIYRTGSRASIA